MSTTSGIHGDGSEPTTNGPSPEDAAVIVRRLHRIEGQVAGLARMVEAGRDCGDIITQLTAAARALDRVGFLLVSGELRQCASADGGPLDEAQAAARLATVEKLFLRLT